MGSLLGFGMPEIGFQHSTFGDRRKLLIQYAPTPIRPDVRIEYGSGSFLNRRFKVSGRNLLFGLRASVKTTDRGSNFFFVQQVGTAEVRKKSGYGGRSHHRQQLRRFGTVSSDSDPRFHELVDRMGLAD